MWAYDGAPITGDMDVWGILPSLQGVVSTINFMLGATGDGMIGNGLRLSFPGLDEDHFGDVLDGTEQSYSTADLIKKSHLVTPLYIYARSFEKSVRGVLSTLHRSVVSFKRKIKASEQ